MEKIWGVTSRGTVNCIKIDIFAERNGTITKEEEDIISRHGEQIFRELQENSYKHDPDCIKEKEEWSRNVEKTFKDAGFSVIYKQEIPNEYSDSNYYPCWYLVTTERGIFKVGPRKRVYNLDYEKLDRKEKATVLFEKEPYVTKGEYYVHANNIQQLTKFLKKIYNS